MNRTEAMISADHVMTVGECLTVASSLSGAKFDPLAMKVWIKQLAAYPAPEIHKAFSNWWASTTDRMLTVAAIVREIERARYGGPSGLWMYASSAAKCAAYASGWHLVVFEHPGIHFAIETLGGWSRLKQITRDAKDASFARTEFDRGLQDYRPGLPYPAGFGHFNGENAVLIGNRERALTVYSCGLKGSDGYPVPGLELLIPPRAPSIGGDVALPSTLLPEHIFRHQPFISTGPAPWQTSACAAVTNSRG